MKRISGTSALLIAISSLNFATGVSAQEEKEKWLIELGSLSTNVDTVLRVDVAGGRTGTEIDLEQDLGFETGKQINRADFRYRFNDKHSIKYSFFQLDRSAFRNIERTFVIGDTEFTLDTDITARFDYQIHSLSYGYSLRSDEQSDLDLLAGIYFIVTRFDVRGSRGAEESFDGAGPLPLIGLNYERKLSRNWNLGARATIFSLDIDDINGSVFDSRIRVDYRFTDSFGLGLAYIWQRLNAGVKDSPLESDFDMTMRGAEISAVLRF